MKFDFEKYGTAHIPEDKDQKLVQTPYGKGLVVRTLGERYEIQLLDWKNDNNSSTESTNKRQQRPATLYTCEQYPSVPVQVNDDVVCMFGRGRVLEKRESDSCIKVLLSSWRLAGRSRVVLYLHQQQQPSAAAVHVVRPKKVYEMNVFEKVEHAMELKSQAATQFAAKNYQQALETYAHAVDTVRYVQHKSDSTNEVRADLLVLMITCCNNAATCCLHLADWTRAHEFAQNALVLIEALENKGSASRIHAILNQEFADGKIFGEWRLKSFLCMARANAEQHETTKALDILKQAHEVLVQYSNDNNNNTNNGASKKVWSGLDKEIKKLYTACKERRKLELKKEKQRALAMFGSKSSKSAEEEKKEMADSPATKTAPTTPRTVSPSASSTASSSSTSEPLVIETSTENGTDAGSHDVTPLSSANLSSHKKKRVSFADDLEHTDGKGVDEIDLPWYMDAEVWTGVLLFASSIGAAALATGYFMNRR